MKRIAGAFILALVLLFPALSVQGQSSIVFDQAMIEIWPEYDRPGVLVIYRITLDAATTLPAQVSLTIPREVGAPYNVAMQDLDGLLYNLAYTTEVQDNTQKIIFTTPAAGLQIEYYDPRLTKDGNNRQFKFEWVAEYSINSLNISVQQPANASDMQIVPSLGAGQVKEDGMTYYTTDIGKVDAGTHLSVELSYTKPDDQLSVGLQPVQPSQPISASTAGKTNPVDIWPWILGGIGVILLVGGFLWFWLTKNRPVTASDSRRRHRPAPQLRTAAIDDGEAIYCHQCGRRASAGDVFCRTCGTRLRP